MCRVQLLTLNPKIIELDIINTRVLVFPWVSTKLRPSQNEFLSIAKVTCIISHRKQYSIHKISKDEQLPNLCENMFACRKTSFCWLQKNCTVQWVARYLHGYLEFAESLFTLDWRLHLSINEYVSYTVVKRTKFTFQWYKDLYIRWFASKLWSEKESTNGRKSRKTSVLHRKVGEITNETWVLKINGGCYEYLTAVLFRYSNR